MNRISSNYEENVQWFNDVLGAGRSCDMVCRDLYVGGRRARFWVIDGFGGDAILERMGAFWLSLQPEAVQGLTEMQQFADRYVTFMEVNVSYDRDDIVTSVLMGKSLLVMEGLSGAALSLAASNGVAFLYRTITGQMYYRTIPSFAKTISGFLLAFAVTAIGTLLWQYFVLKFLLVGTILFIYCTLYRTQLIKLWQMGLGILRGILAKGNK